MKVIIHDIPLLSGGWQKLAFADSIVLKETLYFLETCEPHNSALSKTDINIAGSNKLNDYYIYTSISEVVLYLEEQAKENALSKLSELEKHLLGLNKEVAEVEAITEKPEIKIGGFYRIIKKEYWNPGPWENPALKKISEGAEMQVLSFVKIDDVNNFVVVYVLGDTPLLFEVERFLELYEEVPF